MILEKQTQSLIYQDGVSHDTVEMSLDLDSAQVLMQMLSKSLYSDAIGSTVRECASNALDSHRRAGISDPIIVGLYQSGGSSSWEFSVEDFGIGLDSDDVANIISKYGKSTKRNSTTELGMMGLGFKAPLAYASSFYFTCRKDGMERKYMMYEGEETNSIDLLYEKPTSERNGVKIMIPVKYGDRYDFTHKIKEQLAYFENVYFNVDGIDNNFKIHRAEHYQISELCYDSNLHVCLDNVYYPLDLDKLDLTDRSGNKYKRLSVGIGLRFSLTDGLFPTPNRESLRYTQEAKKIIKDKIEVIANEMMVKYNETIIDTDDVRAVIDYYSNSSKHIKDHNGDQWEVSDMLKFATVAKRTPTLLNCKFFTAEQVYKLRDYLLNEYEGKYELSAYRNRLSECRSHWDQDIRLSNLRRDTKLAVYEGSFPDRKRRYIKELWQKQSVKFIRKSKPFTLFSKDKSWTTNSYYSNPDMRCYHDLLKLHQYSKSNWRTVITEFQGLQAGLTKSFIDLDAIDVPEAWIIADKAKNYKPKPKAAKNGKIKEKGDVNVKQAQTPERETGFNAKFVPMVYDGKLLHKRKALTVYAKEEDRPKLDYLFGLFKKEENEIVFVIMSDREIKVLEMYGLHNFMPLATFLKGHNKPFKRMMTALLINRMEKVYDNTFAIYKHLEEVSTSLSEDLRNLKAYSVLRVNGWVKGESESGLKLEEYAAKHKLYDLETYAKLCDVEKLLSKHPFINRICGTMRGYSSLVINHKGMMDVLKDMCRYKKVRMNLSNYRLVEKQEVNQLEDAA